MTGGRNPGRLASILARFAEVADEIVVAVEEPRSEETHAAVGRVADRVLAFPPTSPADRPIAWLFGACRGEWIFNVDDDEVPSPRLIERLPGLVARSDITHAWIARRWLHPTPDTYLAEPPWSTEVQLRLLMADERSLQFSDAFHRPVVASGPGLFIDAPLWHLDTAVNPVELRRAKAEFYEHERPGLRIGGRRHNHALYVPEMVPSAAIADVPTTERAWIEAALEGRYEATRSVAAPLAHVAAEAIDAAWPGTPYSASLHRGRVELASQPATMRAGVQETIDVYVTNESDVTWRFGSEARPEIRLGYRFATEAGPASEPLALRTVLPADLLPGETQFVPVHVVPPPRPGRYALSLELIHEGISSFGAAPPIVLDVRERELLGLVGTPAAVVEMLERLAPAPTVEPVIVLGNESDRLGYGALPAVPGLRGPLLGGLEPVGGATLYLRLIWRSARLVSAARRYGRGAATHDARLIDLFDLLEGARAHVVASPDWSDDAAVGREWWMLLTTMRVARALGCEVLVADAVSPSGTGSRDRVGRWLIGRCGRHLGPAASGVETGAAEAG